MTVNDNRKIAEIFIRIGQQLKDDQTFLLRLESFLNSQKTYEKSSTVNLEKISSLDLFQLIREKSEASVEGILLTFNVKELREILKKYRFGSSSKLKSEKQIVQHIVHQLRQRKIDVFQTHKNDKTVNDENSTLVDNTETQEGSITPL